MSKKKVKHQTKHSLERFGERCGITDESTIKAMCRSASVRGMSIGNLPDCSLKDYLLPKSMLKRIKVYKDRIYVFNKNTDKCITMYPIPNEYLNEYHEKMLERKNKKRI